MGYSVMSHGTIVDTGLVWRVRVDTPRLRYVVKVLCETWSALPYRIVPAEEWETATVPTGWRVIDYGSGQRAGADLVLPYSGFLEQAGIDFILPPWNAGGFFPGEGDFGWDLPAMAFYVLTLYPLYDWLYGYDEWGLYAWHHTPFYEAPFWREPFLLKHWQALLELLNLRLPKPRFTWEIGWDIDHLYAWKGRGGWRWWLGGLRRGDLPLRLRVRKGRTPDPYDTISVITEHFSPDKARFFFLLSQAHPRDSLISPDHPDLQRVIRQLVEKGYAVGLHPSFRSRDEPERIQKEKERLEAYTGTPVLHSRQHYLRFWMPHTLQTLVNAGIREDFTLAFPKRSGFLLGTTLPVPFYRVDTEEELPLILWGPVLMDRVLINAGFSALTTEIQRLLETGRATGGRLHFIWHNSTWHMLPLEALKL